MNMTMTNTMTNEVAKTPATASPRTCHHCEGPIPEHMNANTRFCHGNCSRVAGYQRRSPEERAEINKRSNYRRYKQDLLPILRSVSHIPDYGLAAGSDVAKLAVACFLIERLRNWKLNLALNYEQARNKLATLAGGDDEFEALEDLVTAEMLKVMETAR
jgi:hypothetical protein